MNNSIYNFPRPVNEPVKEYGPGTGERCALLAEIENLRNNTTDIPIIIGGKEIRTNKVGTVVMPHDHQHVVATYHKATEHEVNLAIENALKAHKEWENTSWVERASISLKAAELISGKYRNVLNAATMLGQSKNVYQAEIDAVCETIDFLRFNTYNISQIYNLQPASSQGVINRIEYRPLEGFIYAISPFNFTSVGANLCMAPVLMGNTIVWKPATTSLLSSYILMKIFMEAGLPAGVINFIPGQGDLISDIVLAHKDFAGLHFTGSTDTFINFWKKISENISHYKSYPKIVGETGGKDFIFVHKSALVSEVATALVRGAFEYQGQKCSAASRSYISQSLWANIKSKMLKMIEQIKIGNVDNFENFMNAVIDEKAYGRIMNYINFAKESSDAEIICGGNGNKSVGYFIEPTVIVTKNPHFKTLEEEIFGPVLTIYIYEDSKFEETLELCDNTSPYALTGAVFAQDRTALNHACRVLKYSAGNFYLNDKPTGAVVGQQPFGGSRASGTNDKAGSYLNLMRWTSPRTIKETLSPPTDFKYPFMIEGA
ncbi:MAG: 1-pyrroline-5-carboxylate dehydrogenase, partial [Bacteroidetes bacterium GWA2_30_7]